MRVLKKLFTKRRLLVVGIAMLVISSALLLLLPKKSDRPLVETVSYSTDTPDETKPDKDSYSWQGGPKDPKYIVLPTINVEGFVQRVGVDQNQQVAVPTNIHMAGWFVDSKSPGENGLSIIDGHLNGQGAGGIFLDLEKLKAGDEYTVELGDGSIKKYRVSKVTTIGTKQSVNVLFSQDPKVKSQLNLITCGGNFDRQNRLYDKRVIASSELVD